MTTGITYSHILKFWYKDVTDVGDIHAWLFKDVYMHTLSTCTHMEINCKDYDLWASLVPF